MRAELDDTGCGLVGLTGAWKAAAVASTRVAMRVRMMLFEVSCVVTPANALFYAVTVTSSTPA